MKLYKVTGPVCSVGAGVVVFLDADQYRRRKHRFDAKDVKGNDEKGYKAKTKDGFDFKHDETFGYDGPLDKNFASNAEEVDKDGNPVPVAEPKKKKPVNEPEPDPVKPIDAGNVSPPTPADGFKKAAGENSKPGK